MTPQKQYEHWKAKSSAVACRFARFIGRNPSRFGQVVKTLNAQASPKIIAAAIERVVSGQIATGETKALAIVLPKIETFDKLVAAMGALGELNHWSLETKAISHPDGANYIAFSLRRDIPTANGGSMPSEVLVFGNFDHFPATRRAPYVAIEMYVGFPSDSDPKTGEPATKATLAHITMPAMTDETLDNLWEQTRVARLESLGGIDDPRAKAKVSFVAPVPVQANIEVEQ